MKVIIRYLGIHMGELSLEASSEEDQEYFIGREPSCQLRLTQEFMSRRHGRIFRKDGKWCYQDLRRDHSQYQADPREINHEQAIDLGNDMDLVTETFLSSESTGTYHLVDLKEIMSHSQQNRRKIALVAKTTAVVGSLALALALYFHVRRPMEVKELLEHVKTKVVEFDQVKDQAAIDQIKKYAGLSDQDFRESAGFCSGFIIAPDVILTAKHCIRGQSDFDLKTNFRIKTHDGREHQVSSVLGFDTKRDYLFLQVNGLEQYGHLEFSEDVEIGQKVYTIGNVEGQGVAIRDGITASRTRDPDDPQIEYLRYSAAASPGNSGGPLVDGWGRVIGLVFARSYSENYNLATAAEHLKKGRSLYVDNRQTKTITLDSKKMFNYNGMNMLQLLGLPTHFSWHSHPELTADLNKMQIDIQVPERLDTLAQTLLRKTNQKFTEKYLTIAKKMKQKKISEGQWQGQINKDTPLIIPSRMELSDLRVNKIKTKKRKSVILPVRLHTLKPASHTGYKEFAQSLKREKSYRYYASTRPLYHLLEKQNRKQKAKLKRAYSTIPMDRKINLSYLFYEPVFHAHLDFLKRNSFPSEMQNQESSGRFPASEELKQSILSKEGLLTDYIHNPFLRPKSFSPFTLKNFDEVPRTDEVQDGLGRIWKLTTWKLFGWLTFDQYCLPLPQGSICATKTHQTDNSTLLEVVRQNFVRFNLTEFMLEPTFWDLKALQDFKDSGYAQNLQGLTDIEFKENRHGGIHIRFKKIGFTFKYSKKERPQMLRFAPALFLHEGESQWMASALQTYHGRGRRHKICAVEIELNKSHSSYLNNQYRDLVDLGSHLKRMKKKRKSAPIRRKKLRSRSLASQTSLYGTCGKLTSSDYGQGEYYLDYLSLKPYGPRVSNR